MQQTIGSLLCCFICICLLIGCEQSPDQRENQFQQQETPMIIERIHGTGEATHAVIWLHGLGASADDFPPIIPELGLNPQPTIKFIFPQAPNRPITINGGMRMPGWYDIKGLQIADKQDRQGVDASRDMLEGIVQEQIDLGIPSENIILAGFSQGGAVAYYTALRSQHTFAGVLALSTYLLFDQQTEQEQTGKNHTTPMFATHGSFDDVVPLELGKRSAETLQSFGYSVEWKEYPMAHQVSMQQIEDIGQWINTVFQSVMKDK